MAWYKTGTVTVTNGSATVTGAGTAFVGAVLAGQGFAAPDGKIYEIDTVVSATQITLASPYLGATAAGAAYGIVPTSGGLSSFATRLDTLLTAMQGVVDGAGQGKFAAGTPAAPGMRYTADGDTGFTNPAANQIGMVAGGVLRALLSGTAFNLSVPITGVAVTQTAIDTTAGRLTKVGDFGLGSIGNNPGASDYSTLGGVSQIITDSITPTPADKPTLGRAFAGLHLAAAANRWVQMLAEVAGGSDVAKLWFRRNYGGTISAWQQIFSQGNILGTVSQASGVPTGAIIELGSNANGVYIRFADGTQICSSNKAAATGAAATWTFPAAFVASPVVVGSAVATVLSAVCLDAAPGTTSVTFSARDKTDARRADTCHLHAIGRWF